jgi:parvulin-like peptidyl-prolyl isomerase
MAKKTKEKKPDDLKHAQPRRHASRRRHEQEVQRRIYIGLGIVLALVALLIAIGAINEYWIKPNKPVAVVNGDKISQDAFKRRLRFEQDNLVSQINQYLQFGEQFANGGPNPFISTVQPFYNQLSDPQQLAYSVLDKMIEETVVHQLAPQYDATVTPEEVQAEIEQQFGYDREADQANAGASDTMTNTAPTMTEDEFQQRYNEYVQNMADKGSLTEEEFRDLFATFLMKDKLAKNAPLEFDTTAEAVKVRYILIKPEPEVPLVKREADALKAIMDARKRIVDDGEDFATVAKEVSEDPGSAPNGGDLGCFSKGQMVPEFEKAAFDLEKGEVSQPVKTDFGYHIIQVYDTKPDEGQVCARHILIRVDRSPDQDAIDKADADALKEAEEVKARIESGEDFATVAKEVSDDEATASKGGELGWVFRGQKGDAFDEVAFSLDPGQIGGPIKMDDGYAIIQVEEKDPEHQVDEKEMETRRQQAFNDWLNAQVAAADVTKNLTPEMIPPLPADLQQVVRELSIQFQQQPAQPTPPAEQPAPTPAS